MNRTLLLPLLVLACANPQQQPRLAEVEQLRADIARPDRYPIRQGLQIDGDRVKQALLSFASAQRGLLDARFAAELRALPTTSAPASPEYGTVLEIRGDDLESQSMVESMTAEYVLDPNPERLAQRAMFMLLPIYMSRVGMTMANVSSWLGFFHVARPQVSSCGGDATHAVICIDYGGLDVLLVRLAVRGPAWVPELMSWQQRGRK